MEKCIVCNKKSLTRVIELGLHPPADSFVVDCGKENAQKFYQLSCMLCESCGHLQNEVVVPNNERYVDTDYSYTSSNSKISMNHWSEYFATVSKKIKLQNDDIVIEFGSNDGYLLELFSNKAKTVGIEPSPYLCDISRQRGLDVINGYLGKETINDFIEENGLAKLIYGNNVYNHINELNESTFAIRSGLRKDGYFVFESPYCLDIIDKYYFDTIYHEHLSYFSIRSVDCLLKKNSLYIVSIERNTYHGGSVRVYSSPDSSKYNKDLVNDYIQNEIKSGLFDLSTYDKYMSKITKDRYFSVGKILEMKKKGMSIAAVGAAARSNTLLNYYKLDSTIIDFITDSSEHKIGKLTPGTCIPILDDNALIERDPDVAIILSWNIGKFLLEKIKNINPNMKIITIGGKELLW